LSIRSLHERVGGLAQFRRMLKKLRLNARGPLSPIGTQTRAAKDGFSAPNNNTQHMNVEQRLAELGLELPNPPRPAGNYQPWILAGNLLWLAGQFPVQDGKLVFTGCVGAERTEADGYAAARLAALNVLAQIRVALGGFDRLKTLLRVEGHIASAASWNNAPKVLDGASDLFAAVLGERGSHTRTAFTPSQLPLNLTVELVVTSAVND
jgi:enamine deaminase RidA (YjgF/YER057c/UK114 family)